QKAPCLFLSVQTLLHGPSLTPVSAPGLPALLFGPVPWLCARLFARTTLTTRATLRHAQLHTCRSDVRRVRPRPRLARRAVQSRPEYAAPPGLLQASASDRRSAAPRYSGAARPQRVTPPGDWPPPVAV